MKIDSLFQSAAKAVPFDTSIRRILRTFDGKRNRPSRRGRTIPLKNAKADGYEVREK